MTKTKIVLTLAFAVLFAATVAHAQTAQPRTISVTGTATLSAVPDVTVVTFGVEHFEPQLADALAQNREAAASLVKAIKTLGVDEKNISTDGLSVQIEYAYNNGRMEKVTGYRISRTYTVKLTDAKLLERLVETGLDSGANQLMGIDFQVSDIAQLRNDARRQAVQAAKEKAELMAGQLGVKIGKPLNISEMGEAMPMPMRGRGGMMAMAKMADAAAPGETLPLGQSVIQVSVNVSFELE